MNTDTPDTKQRPRKRSRRGRRLRRIAVLIALVLAVAGGGLYRFGGDLFAAERNPVDAPEVETAVAEEGVVSVRIERPATSEPVQIRTLRAPTGGVIDSIADVGQFVPEGRRLVVIDRDVLERQVERARLAAEEAEVDYERALADIRKAEKTLSDREALYDAGAISREQLETARDQLENAEHSARASKLKLDRAELELEVARAERDDAIMRAPFDGTVLSVSTATGERVGQNSTLLTFGDLSSLRFRAELDEYDISSVERGMQVVIRSDVLGEAVSRARVESISPGAEIVNNIPVFRITAVADNSAGVLRPGMSADLQVQVARDSGVVVPSRAVSTDREGYYVEVLIAEAAGTAPGEQAPANPDTEAVATDDVSPAGPSDEPDPPVGETAPEEDAATGDEPSGPDELPPDDDTPVTERRHVELGANDGINVVILSGLDAGEKVVLPEIAGTLPSLAAPPPEPTSTSIIPMPGSGGGGGGGGGGGR